jgi:hypothetical protein
MLQRYSASSNAETYKPQYPEACLCEHHSCVQPLNEEIAEIVVKVIETALIGVAVGLAIGILNL